ncbi:hypothetical protein JB92DRAFT_1235696 [Gautieria morchelliformis]|nr:hypothetical protein JB92DRAFT_1235696 [Gautieria morchelliformis]
MIEMQGILIELLGHFEFWPAPGNREIDRSASGSVIPMYVRLLYLSVTCIFIFPSLLRQG